MIQPNEIESMAESLDVHTSHVQRDYVHGWVLSHLYKKSSLASHLVLKGGNSLRKGYFESARYSRDLDFSTATGISNDELHTELNSLCQSISSDTGIEFDLARTVVVDRSRADIEKTISEAKLYFSDFYGNESSLVLSVRLDVTQFDRIYLPIQECFLIHPYSDLAKCSTLIKCVKLEEILASKMRCLLQRRHIADLYDLVYATVISSEIEINRAELLSTFFKITIFGRRPAVAKGLFLELPFENLNGIWDRFINCPALSRFDFTRAKDALTTLIDEMIPGHAEVESDPVFFPAALRNPIMEAAQSQTVLRFTYDGVERMVEPYELTFKIRRDKVAREYFYGYDQTGGRSSPPGLKTFVSNKVQEVENTDVKFEPRATIELNKAGGAENVSRFEGKPRSKMHRTRTVLGCLPKSPNRRRSVFRSSASYTVECLYCQKRFPRNRPDTKLNPHKDKYGNRCHGKRGYLV